MSSGPPVNARKWIKAGPSSGKDGMRTLPKICRPYAETATRTCWRSSAPNPASCASLRCSTLAKYSGSCSSSTGGCEHGGLGQHPAPWVWVGSWLTVGVMAKAHESSLQLVLNLIERPDGLLLWLVRVPELYSLRGGLGVESALYSHRGDADQLCMPLAPNAFTMTYHVEPCCDGRWGVWQG